MTETTTCPPIPRAHQLIKGMMGYAAFSAGKGKPANPYADTEHEAEWEAGYGIGFDKCGHDKQAAFEAEPYA